jgi:hypothetical protein
MKRLFILAALVGSSFFMSSYANETKASDVVTEAFEATFENASDISWMQVGGLYKATFSKDGMYRSAFFNGMGDLIAVTRNLASTQLPKQLQASLKRELQGRWITELFVVSIEGENTYYATLQNADGALMLKSAGAKKWVVYQKEGN